LVVNTDDDLQCGIKFKIKLVLTFSLLSPWTVLLRQPTVLPIRAKIRLN